MSIEPLLLSGHQATDDLDSIILSLKEQNRKLGDALRMERNRVAGIEAGVLELRHVLSPLYRALQKVFDEFEGMDLGDDTHSASSPKSDAWELWKKKLPGYPAKFIDALLAHHDLDSRQLSITTGCHYTNVAKVIYKLNQAGLVNKNGNRYSLKVL